MSLWRLDHSPVIVVQPRPKVRGSRTCQYAKEWRSKTKKPDNHEALERDKSQYLIPGGNHDYLHSAVLINSIIILERGTKARILSGLPPAPIRNKFSAEHGLSWLLRRSKFTIKSEYDSVNVVTSALVARRAMGCAGQRLLKALYILSAERYRRYG